MNDSFLQEQGVSGALIESVRKFRESYPVAEGLENRMSTPEIPFFGKEILEMAIAALLQGENLLLTGEKATGKNVLAETLAYVFGRPTYNVSFHVNTGSAELIGTDTFQNQEVTLRKGSIYRWQRKAVLVFSMRSTWRKTMRSVFFTPRSTTAASSMCRATIKFRFTRRRG